MEKLCRKGKKNQTKSRLEMESYKKNSIEQKETKKKIVRQKKEIIQEKATQRFGKIRGEVDKLGI